MKELSEVTDMLCLYLAGDLYRWYMYVKSPVTYLHYTLPYINNTSIKRKHEQGTVNPWSEILGPLLPLSELQLQRLLQLPFHIYHQDECVRGDTSGNQLSLELT